MQAPAYAYRYATLDDLDPLRTPRPACWLSPAERQAMEVWRDPRRCAGWLAGRLLAKRLVAARLAALQGADAGVAGPIEIRSAGARPEVLVAGRPLPWSLSISHTRRSVLVALSTLAGTRLGVDLVEPAQYGEAFTAVWFTREERRFLRGTHPQTAATVWAIKEAVYKAANRGEHFDPRAAEAVPQSPGGYSGVWHCGDGARRCRLSLWETPLGEIAVFAVHRSGEHHD